MIQPQINKNLNIHLFGSIVSSCPQSLTAILMCIDATACVDDSNTSHSSTVCFLHENVILLESLWIIEAHYTSAGPVYRSKINICKYSTTFDCKNNLDTH